MKAARGPRLGSPSVITNDDLPRPEPAAGQLPVCVKAAGTAAMPNDRMPKRPMKKALISLGVSVEIGKFSHA
jgi:hypothetical protein